MCSKCKELKTCWEMRNRHQIKLTLKKYSFINQMLHNDRILTEQNYLIKLIWRFNF